jgi:ribosomal protein L37AE/L43A
MELTEEEEAERRELLEEMEQDEWDRCYPHCGDQLAFTIEMGDWECAACGVVDPSAVTRCP